MINQALEIRIGLGSCGIANGARPVHEALLNHATRAGAPEVVKSVGCRGHCSCEPLVEVVEIDGRRTSYTRVTPEEAEGIVRRYLGAGGWLARSRRRLDSWVRSSRLATPPEAAPAASSVAWPRVVLENCGRIDPLSLDDSLARGGYSELERCVRELEPHAVIGTISSSGLRGRGGAGFPTGRKWELARSRRGAKVVICNGDEGDPGAFMDRLVLESDPHRVIEGLAICAWAIGAELGIFYIRAEYPQAVRHVREALRQAVAAGLLGNDLVGSGSPLHFEVREGAGAFVCGEETALIASLEGRRGMPRLRPPYPVEKGFRGQPTVINNVETLACVPWIMRHGAEAFAAIGTESSAGTKVFALAGKIRRGGLVEVPMGINVRTIIEELGGGPPPGRSLKAVQLGGPSGGCIPASLADTAVDYEALRDTGAIMGSGGMVVLDDRDCMVDISRFFLQFTCNESCGKCTFCRIGTRRMLEILDRLCDGQGRSGDLDTLIELGDRVSRASLCGLGQTAPNPVSTALRYFREEFEAHVIEKRCPAGKCPQLIEFRINESCIGCTLCVQACPVDAISGPPYELHVIDEQTCTRCGMCFEACKDGAVEIVSAGRVCVISPADQSGDLASLDNFAVSDTSLARSWEGR